MRPLRMRVNSLARHTMFIHIVLDSSAQLQTVIEPVSLAAQAVKMNSTKGAHTRETGEESSSSSSSSFFSLFAHSISFDQWCASNVPCCSVRSHPLAMSECESKRERERERQVSCKWPQGWDAQYLIATFESLVEMNPGCFALLSLLAHYRFRAARRREKKKRKKKKKKR